MATININVDDDVKLQAQELFSSLGLDMDTAVVARKIAALAGGDLVELRSTYAYPAKSYDETKQIGLCANTQTSESYRRNTPQPNG